MTHANKAPQGVSSKSLIVLIAKSNAVPQRCMQADGSAVRGQERGIGSLPVAATI
jgi:hypothetical protein